jgi:hypothetical protein
VAKLNRDSEMFTSPLKDLVTLINSVPTMQTKLAYYFSMGQIIQNDFGLSKCFENEVECLIEETVAASE